MSITGKHAVDNNTDDISEISLDLESTNSYRKKTPNSISTDFPMLVTPYIDSVTQETRVISLFVTISGSINIEIIVPPG